MSRRPGGTTRLVRVATVGALGLWLAATERDLAASGSRQTARRLIVMIDAKVSGAPKIGAGILFGNSGDALYIATANHVVRAGPREAESVEVQFDTAPDWVPAALMKDRDPNLDLAVLRVDKSALSRADFPFEAMSLHRSAQRGDRVYHMGYAHGQSWHSNVESEPISNTTYASVQFESNTIGGGSSGGGLFSDDWALAGMVVSEDLVPRATRIGPILETLESWNYDIKIGRRKRPVAKAGWPDEAVWNVYKQGQDEAEKRNPRWEAVEQLMSRAIEGHASETCFAPDPLRPSLIVYYMPFYYLGLAKYHLYGCDDAVEDWDASQSLNVIQKRKKQWNRLQKLLRQCKG